jgi:glycosyltransferase involved in cell wall biosynthesis
VKSVWFQHTISSGEAVDRLAALVPADRLYVNSQASLRAIRRLHPIAKTVQVVYPGIETRFPLVTEERLLLKRGLGIPDDALVIAMVGRFQRGKGQHLFIEAAAAVCRRKPDARFILVGDTQFGLEPGYKAELEDLVRRYELSHSVVFTGWRNDVPALLSIVDILVHPSTAPESFGLVVVEALLLGKPVIVSHQGGLTEIVTDGETGFLVPPGDVTVLAGKILLLLSNEGLRREMGERGRGFVLERFTMTRMIEELEQSYFDVVGGAPSTKVLR